MARLSKVRSRKCACAALAWLLLFACGVPAGAPVFAAEWSYEGDTGPDHWADLSPDYATCRTGRRQSPINIETARVEPAELPPLKVDYAAVPLRIVNNGHTIQVNYDPGSTLRVGESAFELRQLHFHAPSEEAIDGRRYPMVAHLVHAGAGGNLAVIAVLFEVDETRAHEPNMALSPIWAHLPEEPGAEQAQPGVSVNAADLVPAERAYFFFDGSLTTPPCTEGVSWFVLRTPAHISQEQLLRFTQIYPDNARPLQPVFGRTVQAGPAL